MARKELKDLVISEFANHRIVFWDDHEGKNKHKFEELNLEDENIVKVQLCNDEFMLKYRMLVANQSESNFTLKLTNKFDEDVYNAAYELLAQEETSKVAQTPSANTTKTLVSTGETVPVAPKTQIKFCKLVNGSK